MKFTQTTLLGLALLVCGLALCGAGAFLLSRPAQYQATARIRVIDRIKYENAATNSNEAFDPYFIPTAFEVMQSETVLSNAPAGAVGAATGAFIGGLGGGTIGEKVTARVFDAVVSAH